jgi:hypothetical protein
VVVDVVVVVVVVVVEVEDVVVFVVDVLVCTKKYNPNKHFWFYKKITS